MSGWSDRRGNRIARVRAARLCALVLIGLLPLPAPAQREPFPVAKSAVLRDDGRRWWVEGRQRVPHQVRIESLKATVIEGRGEESVIELSGALTLRAPVEGKVVLENVWIEVQPDAKELELSMVEFRGGGIRTAGEGAEEPRVFVERSSFDAGASFSMTLFGGEVDLQQTSVVQPVAIRGLPISEKIPNKASVGLLQCRALASGLSIEGVSDVLVRHCDLAGDRVRLANWLKLDFDGNNVRTARAEFELPVYGRFTSAEIHNCDFQVDEIAFRCPPDGEKAEKYSLDHCHFRGLTDSKAIVAAMIVDHTRDPSVGVEIECKRVVRGRMGLGGTTSR
jgi:hypothetical protein